LKKISVLVASIALISSAFAVTGGAASAAADHDDALAGAVAFECQITLFWPTANGGADDCAGTGAGAGTHGTTPFTILAKPFNGHVDSYSEGCVVGPPLTGNASGTATVNTDASGQLAVGFSWIRVGVVAVVTINSASLGGQGHSGVGAGVAAFVPVPPNIPTCEAPGQLTALVAGTAVAAGQ